MKPPLNQLNPTAVIWLFSWQYFVCQIIVAASWREPYSLANNYISDLGNTVCGPYQLNYVCSPLHLLMNLSFVVQGIILIVGAILLARRHSADIWLRWGLIGLGIGGIGSIFVGLFPENTLEYIHYTGAILAFVAGNLGLIILSKSQLSLTPALRCLSSAGGIIGLFALMLIAAHQYIGLGIGGLERVVAYPQTLWVIAYAISQLYRPQQIHKPKRR